MSITVNLPLRLLIWIPAKPRGMSGSFNTAVHRGVSRIIEERRIVNVNMKEVELNLRKFAGSKGESYCAICGERSWTEEMCKSGNIVVSSAVVW
jgi:hypothetical protein